ncbi:MAG: DUF2891 domain-containing protein [Hyphomonadaceae bacterium]
MTDLTLNLADRFARIALGHVCVEYPNKLDHVMTGPEDVRSPRDLHPVFYGSFDWHSCVHGYWLLARTLRRHPEMSAADDVRRLYETSFTPETIEAERAYLDTPASRGFERPYGWAWLLALQAELDRHDGPLAAAAQTLEPLSTAFAKRFADFLPLADYPVRTGVHTSTAFALRLAADHSEARDPGLHRLIREKALAWHGADRDAQAWEPSQDAFLSPTLMEAACMKRLMPASDFRDWFADFLPGVVHGEPAVLFSPARVSDRSDGKIAHLDGLNFSRAWCWRELAGALDEDDPRRAPMEAAAQRHIEARLDHVAGDYMGEHWLATFAVLALDGL